MYTSENNNFKSENKEDVLNYELEQKLLEFGCSSMHMILAEIMLENRMWMYEFFKEALKQYQEVSEIIK